MLDGVTCSPEHLFNRMDVNKPLSNNQTKQLYKRLRFKFGAEIDDLASRAERDKEIHGHVLPDTEARQELLMKKLKDEEKRLSDQGYL